MEFKLEPGQENIRAMAHYFAEYQMRPIAIQADRTHEIPLEFHKTVMNMGLSMGSAAVLSDDKASKKKMADENLPVGVIEKDKQGVSQKNRFAMLGAEELTWGCPALMMTFPGPGLAGPPVNIMGTEEQKELFHAAFRETEPAWGAYALTEPGCGSDAAAISTTARRDGDYYILNGTKSWITNGWRSKWVVVFATLDKAGGREAHRTFLVEKGTPGFDLLKIEEKMGLRASETAQISFTDCRVHKSRLLGTEDYYERQVSKGGFKGAMKTFDATRPMVASMAIGIARAAWEETRKHYADKMMNRPIPVYQRIQTELADLKRQIDASRLLNWRAAWMADMSIPNTMEASMCKAYSANVVQTVTQRCIDLLGVNGAIVDNFVEKCFRDQKVFDIFEGTGQIQRVVISRRIFTKLDKL